MYYEVVTHIENYWELKNKSIDLNILELSNCCLIYEQLIDNLTRHKLNYIYQLPLLSNRRLHNSNDFTFSFFFLSCLLYSLHIQLYISCQKYICVYIYTIQIIIRNQYATKVIMGDS